MEASSFTFFMGCSTAWFGKYHLSVTEVKVCGQTFEGREKKLTQTQASYLQCLFRTLYSWIPLSTFLHLHWVGLTRSGNLIDEGPAVSLSCTIHVLVAGQWLETVAHKSEPWLLITASGFAVMGFIHLQTECFYGRGVCLKNCSYLKWLFYFSSPKVRISKKVEVREQ